MILFTLVNYRITDFGNNFFKMISFFKVKNHKNNFTHGKPINTKPNHSAPLKSIAIKISKFSHFTLHSLLIY